MASTASENDGFLKVNRLVRCILCSEASFIGGLGMIRRCENGPFLLERSGAGSGIPEETLFVRLRLRELSSYFSRERQQSLL